MLPSLDGLWPVQEFSRDVPCFTRGGVIPEGMQYAIIGEFTNCGGEVIIPLAKLPQEMTGVITFGFPPLEGLQAILGAGYTAGPAASEEKRHGNEA